MSLNVERMTNKNRRTRESSINSVANELKKNFILDAILVISAFSIFLFVVTDYSNVTIVLIALIIALILIIEINDLNKHLKEWKKE